MDKEISIVWFRKDLRLSDHLALEASIKEGKSVIPLFIWSTEEKENSAFGSASKFWLHYSLEALKESLEQRGSFLLLKKGPFLSTLLDVIQESGASSVFWHKDFEPRAFKRDLEIEKVLKKRGIKTGSFNGSHLFHPWDLSTKLKKPFQVFTPFWKSCLQLTEESYPEIEAPKTLFSPLKQIKTLPLEELQLLPDIPWDVEMKRFWSPGEEGAKTRLLAFLGEKEKLYADLRNRPDQEGISYLSPHLHFGEISPKRIWNRSKQEPFLRQLGWREFANHLLFYFPQTEVEPLREEFKNFPWQLNENFLRAWQKGKTGYPIVDAGMRQLWKIGWMHNRVRMIVGSFLVKDLQISWKEGVKWFEDTLVDADLANNTLGWQWVAGCGADAAPYFRVFNPVLQGEKFDPDGSYVRKWVPELKYMPKEWIHKPWEAPPLFLRQWGVVLGSTYPFPLVDHAAARQLALLAFNRIKMEK